MKIWDIAKGELVDPDTPTLGEKFSIAGMDMDLNIQVSIHSGNRKLFTQRRCIRID